MRAPVKLGLYAAGLVVVFLAAYLTAGALIPAETAAAWTARAEASSTDGSDHNSTLSDTSERASVPGLSVEQDGYQIRDVTAPTAAGVNGTLSFRIVGPDDAGVDGYTVAHEKDLHLIVVRSDGAQFRHVHPDYNGDGRWSIPWQWESGGSYRVFADFVPTALGANLTLTSTVTVTGGVVAAIPTDGTVARAGEFSVNLAGGLTAGGQSTMTFTVSRDGGPVTTLEPYLGAFGHLVALRDGDLAYLHVHPVGEPTDGITLPGPDIQFEAEAPTDGRYLLYLDFQVDGRVHTAEFTVIATAGTTQPSHPTTEHLDSGH